MIKKFSLWSIMKSKALSIIPFMILFILSGCYDGAKGYYKRAERLSKSKALEDWELAISEYEKIVNLKIEAYDKMAYLHRRLADLFLEREMFKKAEEHYLAAIEILPNMPELHCSLGICYANLGRTEEGYIELAISEYEKAIRLKKDFAKPYYGLGIIYFFKMDKLEEGISNIKKAIEYNPDYIEAFIALGRMYYESSDYTEAIKTYERIISKYPKNAKILATYYDNIGLSYLALGAKDKAALNFRKALKIDKEYKEARAHLQWTGIEVE